MAYSSPTVRSPKVMVAPAYQAQKRTSRRPQHKFNLITKPYQLQPFMIAPVPRRIIEESDAASPGLE